jgi:hypothetical protein
MLLGSYEILYKSKGAYVVDVSNIALSCNVYVYKSGERPYQHEICSHASCAMRLHCRQLAELGKSIGLLVIVKLSF